MDSWKKAKLIEGIKRDVLTVHPPGTVIGDDSQWYWWSQRDATLKGIAGKWRWLAQKMPWTPRGK